MKRSELAGSLRQPFTQRRGFGIEKIDKPGYENTWFVVPPQPPVSISEKPDLSLVRDAIQAIQARTSFAAADEFQKALAYLLAWREAVSSSRMEGTWSTVDEVLSPVISDADRSATAAVRGYAAALVHGVEAVRSSGLTELTSELLCELHTNVM